MVFINCAIASIKKTLAPIDTKDWQSELNESLPPRRYCVLDDYLVTHWKKKICQFTI